MTCEFEFKPSKENSIAHCCKCENVKRKILTETFHAFEHGLDRQWQGNCRSSKRSDTDISAKYVIEWQYMPMNLSTEFIVFNWFYLRRSKKTKGSKSRIRNTKSIQTMKRDKSRECVTKLNWQQLPAHGRHPQPWHCHRWNLLDRRILR